MWKILILAVLLMGCATTHPQIAYKPVIKEVMVTTESRLVWASMEYCVGRVEPVKDWRWFVVQGDRFFQRGYPYPIIGLTDRSQKRIYLASSEETNIRTVRHEILHALGISDLAPIFSFCGAKPNESELFQVLPDKKLPH